MKFYAITTVDGRCIVHDAPPVGQDTPVDGGWLGLTFAFGSGADYYEARRLEVVEDPVAWLHDQSGTYTTTVDYTHHSEGGRRWTARRP